MPGRRAAGRFGGGDEQQVQRRRAPPGRRARSRRSACSSSAVAALASSPASSRGPGRRRERDRGDELRVVRGGRSGGRRRPTPSRTRTRRTSASCRTAAGRADQALARASRSGSAAASRSRGDAQPLPCSARGSACDSSGCPGASEFHAAAGKLSTSTSSRNAMAPGAGTASGGGEGDAVRIHAPILAASGTRARKGRRRGQDAGACPAPADRCTHRANISPMQIALAQLNQSVGDLRGNARGDPRRRGRGRRGPGRRLVVTPELSLCGYPPEDLLLRRRSWTPARANSPRWPRRCVGRASPVVVGFPEDATPGAATTRWRCSRGGRVAADLPQAAAAQLHGVRRGALLRARRGALRGRGRRPRLGLIICEDVWFAGPAPAGAGGRRAGARRRQRLAVPHPAARAAARAGGGARPRDRRCRSSTSTGSGGQDELVFDGASFVGRRRRRGRPAAAGLARDGRAADLRRHGAVEPVRGSLPAARSRRRSTRRWCWACATTCGKNRFPGVISGCPAASTRR